MNDLLAGVSHLKQSTIRIQSDKVIYIDPFGIDGTPEDADVIFVSHGHYDHFSIEDIKKLAKKDTVLVIPEDCVKAARDAGFENSLSVRPSLSYEVNGLNFNTIPAYNIGKFFHPKDKNWVGYVLKVNNVTYYFAGDTDFILEMKDVKADVAFLPVGGTYTMTWKEAAEAANTISPQVAVPIHFADLVGTADDAQNFVNGLNSTIQGVILKNNLTL